MVPLPGGNSAIAIIAGNPDARTGHSPLPTPILKRPPASLQVVALHRTPAQALPPSAQPPRGSKRGAITGSLFEAVSAVGLFLFHFGSDVGESTQGYQVVGVSRC